MGPMMSPGTGRCPRSSAAVSPERFNPARPLKNVIFRVTHQIREYRSSGGDRLAVYAPVIARAAQTMTSRVLPLATRGSIASQV
jgi:hypothetical protein